MHWPGVNMILEVTCNPGFIGGSMSGGEILLVLLALLMLFGSKNLPSIARNIGKSMETFRRASREVTDEIMRADIDSDRPVKPKPANKKSVETPDDEEPPLEVKPTLHAVKRDDESNRS